MIIVKYVIAIFKLICTLHNIITFKNIVVFPWKIICVYFTNGSALIIYMFIIDAVTNEIAYILYADPNSCIVQCHKHINKFYYIINRKLQTTVISLTDIVQVVHTYPSASIHLFIHP